VIIIQTFVGKMFQMQSLLGTVLVLSVSVYTPGIQGKIVSSIIKDNSHWEELALFNISNSDIPVAKYKSKLTGLTIAIAKAETPVVNGYFCLPTEAHDDDGLPHILEHLIFLGSEDYPYKEVLDLLANRCLAKRTNAWTSTDHTCYTVFTAGTSGFLQILPIYLDHILFPTLRAEDFTTEVHHINGKGQDAGVVYSEIQGSKYAVSSSKALKEVLYPGNSGYYAQTGGSLENIRNSTTIEKVRQYHKKLYRAENLILTITGRIDELQLFEKVRSIEEKIIKKRSLENKSSFERPWQKKLQATGLEENHVFEHKFPSDDESKGHVLIGWRLEDRITKDIPILEAYQLMMQYLTSSKVSPLEAEFAESTDPLASSVGFYSLDYSEPALLIKFSNVPTNRTSEILPKMKKVIQKVLDDGPSKFDLVRIHDYIDRGIVKNQKENENSPHLFLPDATLLDKLYGQKNAHFKQFVVASQWSAAYKDRNASYWLGLMDEIFNKHLSVAVEAKPSLKLSTDYTEMEEKREKKQIEDLGPEGIEKKKQELETALESQTLPGNDILTQIPLGDVEKIQFRSLNSYNRTHNAGNLFNFSGIPFKIHIDDVNSKFVTLYVYIDLAGLSIKQRKYLPLLIDLWTTSPMKKNGSVTDIGGVIKRYNKSLLKLEMSQGYSYLTIGAQAELIKLKEGVSFLSDRINYPYFTMKELNTTIGSRLNVKTPGASSIKSELFDGLYFDNTTFKHYTSHQVQKSFLTKLKEEIKTNVDSVLEELYQMVDILAKPERSFLYVAGKAEDMTKTYGSDLLLLSSIFNSSSSETDLDLSERFEIKREHEYRKKKASNLRHVALGVDSTKSCYMSQSIFYNSSDWMAKDVSDTRVLLKYLSDRLYHEVRGKGLTYSISMYLSVSTGRIVLSMSKSAQLADAYKAVREIFQNYVEGQTSWDEALSESAKGALIYSWAEKEETVTGLVSQAVRAYTRQTDSKYNRYFTKSLANVNTDDLKAAANKLLPQFLLPNSTQTVVVCNKGRINEVVDDLSKFGMEIKLYDSFEDTFLNFE